MWVLLLNILKIEPIYKSSYEKHKITNKIRQIPLQDILCA